MNNTIVFVCFTPYQLLNAVYYGNRLGAEVRRVLIWHNYTKYNLDLQRFNLFFDDICEISNFYEEPFFKRQFHKCLYGGWLFRLSKINRLLKTIDIKNTILCLFSDQHIVSRRILTTFGQRAFDVVLIEEGMATYLIRNKAIPKSKDMIINLFLGARYEPYIGANKLIKTIFVKYPYMLPEEKKNNRVVVLQNNVFRDDMWNGLFSDVLKRVNWDNNDQKKTVLWLGQPIEMDGVPTDIQLKLLKRINEMVGSEYQILVKSHPREDDNKYITLTQETSIMQIQLGEMNWIPIEVLAGIIKPDIVLTAYSTAANNILELGLECKVIYCYQMLELYIGEHISDLIADSPQVYIIHSYEEFETILKQENDSYKGRISNNSNNDLNYLLDKLSDINKQCIKED